MNYSYACSRNGGARQDLVAATSRRAAASRPRRRGARSSMRPGCASSATATRRRRSPRSPRRPTSRRRRSTSPSRPRAACCARCGTSCCAATRTTPGGRARRGSARCSTSPIPSGSCASTRATRAGEVSGPARCSASSAARPRSTPTSAALWARIETDFHANQGAMVASIDEGRAAARARRRARDRHPLDAQPPRRLAPARRPRGWTPEEFESWFADATCSELLG